jgi:hypothetical protein
MDDLDTRSEKQCTARIMKAPIVKTPAKRGRGRPRKFAGGVEPFTLTLPPAIAQAIRDYGKDEDGKGNLSVGIVKSWQHASLLLTLINSFSTSQRLECSDANEMLQYAGLTEPQRKWLESFNALWEATQELRTTGETS